MDNLEICVQQALDTIEHANRFEKLLLTKPKHVINKDGFGFWWDCYLIYNDGLELSFDFFAEPIAEFIHGLGTRKLLQVTLKFSEIEQGFGDKFFENTPFANLVLKIVKKTLLKVMEERN